MCSCVYVCASVPRCWMHRNTEMKLFWLLWLHCCEWLLILWPKKIQIALLFSSVTQSCPTLCNPMDCSKPGLPVLHYLPEFAQTHIHHINSTISSSVTPLSLCPQSFPASGSFSMSQLFASDCQSIGASAKVLPVRIQGWVPWGLADLISLLSKGLSRVFPSTTIGKYQLFSAQAFL